MKRFISYALSAVMLLTLMLPTVLALTDDPYSDLEMVVGNILAGMEHDKDGYGLASVDFSQLHISNEIPNYRVEQGKLVETEVKHFALVHKDEIVAIISTALSPDNQLIVQIGKTFADELQGIDEAMAFVVDSESVYAISENHKVELVKNKSVDAELSLIDNISRSDIMSIEKAEVETQTTKQVALPPAEGSIQRSASSTPNQHYLSVSMKSQGNADICWAASIASVGQYLTGTQYTPNEVVLRTSGSSSSAPYSSYAGWMNSLYGISATRSQSTIGFPAYKQHISAGLPMMAAFNYSLTSMGHVVVMRGYYTNSNTTSFLGSFSYMDPNYTTYQASNVLPGDGYYFVMLGRTYSLSNYWHINSY